MWGKSTAPASEKCVNILLIREATARPLLWLLRFSLYTPHMGSWSVVLYWDRTNHL